MLKCVERNKKAERKERRLFVIEMNFVQEGKGKDNKRKLKRKGVGWRSLFCLSSASSGNSLVPLSRWYYRHETKIMSLVLQTMVWYCRKRHGRGLSIEHKSERPK